MSESLPSGWARTTLGEIGRYLNGRAFKSHEWSDRGRIIIRIQDLTGSGDSPNRYEGEVEPRHEVRAGDLLISWAATLGAYVWRGPDAVLNQHIFKVESHIDQRFHYWLVTGILDDLRRQAHGSGMVHITKGRFDATPVALPPLAEQRRIVDALEEHLSELDAAVAGLERARANLERYRLAVRAAALAESESSEWSTVGELARVGTGATPLRSRAAYFGGGTIPWVTSGALNAGTVSEPSDFVTELALRETNLTVYPPGTLLVAMYGEGKTRGRCADLAIHATTNQAIAALQVRPEYADVQPWLRLVLDAGYEAMRRSASGGVQPNLNLSIVRAIAVPLPARAERERILAHVERCLGAAHRAAADVEMQLARASRLRQSILQCAFSGRLVPQHPTDEPAESLLERLRAQRDSRSPSRKARAGA